MLLRSTCFSRHQGRVFNHGRRRCSAATDCPDEAVAASVVSAVPLLVVVFILRGDSASVCAKIFFVPLHVILDRSFSSFIVQGTTSCRPPALSLSSARRPLNPAQWPTHRRGRRIVLVLSSKFHCQTSLLAGTRSYSLSQNRPPSPPSNVPPLRPPTNFRVKYANNYATDRYRR